MTRRLLSLISVWTQWAWLPSWTQFSPTHLLSKCWACSVCVFCSFPWQNLRRGGRKESVWLCFQIRGGSTGIQLPILSGFFMFKFQMTLYWHGDALSMPSSNILNSLRVESFTRNHKSNYISEEGLITLCCSWVVVNERSRTVHDKKQMFYCPVSLLISSLSNR